MIDTLVCWGWPIGVVLLWYPTYELLLKTFGNATIDTMDRLFAVFIGGMIAVFWPVALSLVVICGGGFYVSRIVNLRLRRLWKGVRRG